MAKNTKDNAEVSKLEIRGSKGQVSLANRLSRAATLLADKVTNGYSTYSSVRALPGYADDVKLTLRSCGLTRDHLPAIGRLIDQFQRKQSKRHSQRHVNETTLKSRLTAIRVAAITRSIRRSSLHSCGKSVTLTDAPEQVGAHFESVDVTRKNDKWRRYEHTLHIVAPSRWRTRVERAGLAVVDGIFTLDAARLETRGDIAIYAATWIEQRRGYACEVVRGYIATTGTVSFHAKTARLAASGLARKRAMTPEVRRELNERLTAGKLLRDAERITAGLDLDKVTVTVGDARRIGACEYGIRSWCHRVGIDYETGQATLRAVVEGYREYPLPEVRATLIAVCEKQRHVSA